MSDILEENQESDRETIGIFLYSLEFYVLYLFMYITVNLLLAIVDQLFVSYSIVYAHNNNFWQIVLKVFLSAAQFHVAILTEKKRKYCRLNR